MNNSFDKEDNQHKTYNHDNGSGRTFRASSDHPGSSDAPRRHHRPRLGESRNGENPRRVRVVSSRDIDDQPRPHRPRIQRPRPQNDDANPYKSKYQGSKFGKPKTKFKPKKQARPQQPQQPPQPKKPKQQPPMFSSHTDTMRLNKYIAHAGICSRREADKLIEAGSIKVNGVVCTTLGYQVKESDVVSYGGETLRSEAKRYFLLNKPKGYITTLDDPQERQTVMMLIDSACKERIYPVGRLDRNTTGLLLFTNDGELAKKLTHPSSGVYKIYQVELNKAVTREDMNRMLNGIELDDGPIAVDDVQYVEAADDRRVVGVALHSGKNRIVRRIFEHLGYEVHKLDRVVFAGLTKKDLPRGRYRELTEQEVSFLKMI